MNPRFETARKDALDFLNAHNTAVVATASKDVPSASTVYYVVDEDFNFYFITRDNTDKALNMSRNSDVALVVGTGPEHISVSVHGTAHLVSGEEQTAVFERLMMIFMQNRIKKWPAKDMIKFQDYGMHAYKVTPTRLTYMNLDDPKYAESASNRYITIIP